MDNKLREALLAAAVEASQHAYAPYSRFLVGAAVLGKNGVIYPGANVENASYGLTNCAERSAVFSAVSAGENHFEAVAIASSGGVAPCGACRQVLHEFSPSIKVLLIDTINTDQVTELSLEDLLPDPFPSKNGA